MLIFKQLNIDRNEFWLNLQNVFKKLPPRPRTNFAALSRPSVKRVFISIYSWASAVDCRSILCVDTSYINLKKKINCKKLFFVLINITLHNRSFIIDLQEKFKSVDSPRM